MNRLPNKTFLAGLLFGAALFGIRATAATTWGEIVFAVALTVAEFSVVWLFERKAQELREEIDEWKAGEKEHGRRRALAQTADDNLADRERLVQETKDEIAAAEHEIELDHFLAGLRTGWSILSRASGIGTIGDWHYWLWITPPWRPFYRAWLLISRWYKQFRFGKRATASWTGILSAMTLVYKPGDSVFLGRLWVHGIGLWQPIGIRGPRHITVVAGAGAGKTRWLMGWLGMLHKKASAFIIDCDGQMVNALGPHLNAPAIASCVLILIVSPASPALAGMRSMRSLPQQNATASEPPCASGTRWRALF